jgi:hypothetical protein
MIFDLISLDPPIKMNIIGANGMVAEDIFFISLNARKENFQWLTKS